MTLTFWHICNASSALDFARSRWCLSTPVQSVKNFCVQIQIEPAQHSVARGKEMWRMWKYAKKRKLTVPHRKVHMDKDTMFTCQICAKTFNRRDNLHTHVIKCHDEPLPSEQYKCIITLVAFIWPFSTVRYQMSSQIACFWKCIITLVAFIWPFSTVRYQMSSQIACFI